MKKLFAFVLATMTVMTSFAANLSCNEAESIAKELQPNTPSTETYTVEGYVVSVIKASAEDLRFWMADKADAELGNFEAWMCTGDVVNKGDKVTVTGNLQWYVDEKNPDDQKAEIYKGTVKVTEPAPVDENYVEFYAADFEGKGTSGSGSEVKVTKNGVTVYTNGGFGNSYSLRVYKNKQFTISSTKRIIQIVFTFDNGQGDYSGGLDPEVCVEGTEYVVESMASQGRFSKIQVYMGDDECSIVPPVIEEITVTEALEIAKTMEPEEKKSLATTEKYAVSGYVVSVSSKNENTFYMADDPDAYGEFQAYKCASVDSNVAEGDYVTVTGKITTYHGVSGDEHYFNYEISGGDLVHSDAPEAVENVFGTYNATKVIEDGQVVIIRNGVRYNAVGTVIE